MRTTPSDPGIVAILSILDEARDFKGLEQACVELGMRFARCIMEAYLGDRDDALARARPRGLRSLGFRERVLLTRFGEMVMRRRCYREKSGGKVRYLLDEDLGIPPEVRVSVGLVESMVAGAVEEPFRQVVRRREEEGLASPSHSAVHKWVRKLGERAKEDQARDREAVFGRGETLPSQMRRTPCLFMEADGVIVHLQGEEERRGEVKIGLSYESWEKRTPGSREWTLTNRRVAAGVCSGEEFWEGMTVELGRVYDLSSVEYGVVNGDGAAWVDEAGACFAGVEVQADRFHLYREVRTVYGSQAGSLIRMLERGDVAGFMDTIEASVEGGKTAEENRIRRALFASLQKRKDTLLDYRFRERRPPEGVVLRGMGAIEGYVDKVVANRMKKRGMRWSLAGADAMARLLAKHSNGELTEFTARHARFKTSPTGKPGLRLREKAKEDPEAWLRKAMPVLYGPHSAREWVVSIRRMLGG